MKDVHSTSALTSMHILTHLTRYSFTFMTGFTYSEIIANAFLFLNFQYYIHR